MTSVEEMLLNYVVNPRPTMLVCSEAIVTVAKREKKLSLRRISKIQTIYGLNQSQQDFYINMVTESKSIFGDVSEVTPEFAEYIHSLLESFL